MNTSFPANLNATQHFNYPNLTHIASISNHSTMIVLQIELNADAVSVHSDQISLGNLSLVMLPTKYAILDPTNYIIYTNPNTGPSIAPNDSAIAIGDARWTHTVNKETYDICILADNVLKM